MENWAKIFRKVCPKTCSEHVWILLGTLLGFFGILKTFFFENFRKLDPPWNTGHKIVQKIFPKTCPKHVWILLGTLLGIFGILKPFFFENFRKLDPPRNTGQKNFSKNLTQNMFKTRLDTFGNDFGHFWNFANFLIFLKTFEDSTFHGKLGKNFSKSLPQKLVQNTFGYFWERFWAF